MKRPLVSIGDDGQVYAVIPVRTFLTPGPGQLEDLQHQVSDEWHQLESDLAAERQQ